MMPTVAYVLGLELHLWVGYSVSALWHTEVFRFQVLNVDQEIICDSSSPSLCHIKQFHPLHILFSFSHGFRSSQLTFFNLTISYQE